jgi:YhcH/YjgK/YiaL family protein
MRGLSATMEYDSEKDVILYDLADGTDVKLESGDFVILYPHDAHVPTLQSGSPADVKKIVLKVRV